MVVSNVVLIVKNEMFVDLSLLTASAFRSYPITDVSYRGKFELDHQPCNQSQRGKLGGYHIRQPNIQARPRLRIREKNDAAVYVCPTQCLASSRLPSAENRFVVR